MEDQLAIFDIDGTLTNTTVVDDECYRAAVAEVLSLTAAEVLWSEAPHVTDTGIAIWLWQKHRGRAPTTGELKRVQSRFSDLLRAELAAAPHRFTAIRGAGNVVARLRAEGWAVALATGGWRVSAALKLRAAEISCADVVLACSDDAWTREQIVQAARDRAEVLAGGPFQRVVSVGDGPWDVRTARALGLPFVGIGSGENADRLRACGARVVIDHLEDWSHLIQALREATVPHPGAGEPSRALA